VAGGGWNHHGQGRRGSLKASSGQYPSNQCPHRRCLQAQADRGWAGSSQKEAAAQIDRGEVEHDQSKIDPEQHIAQGKEEAVGMIISGQNLARSCYVPS
jgi:hypothetical protein